MTDRPALLLDLDGTLVDSVYQHALAWHKALELGGIELSVWRIHRRIGMSGGLLADSLARETGHELSENSRRRTRDCLPRSCATCVHCRARKTSCGISPRWACRGPSRRVARWRVRSRC